MLEVKNPYDLAVRMDIVRQKSDRIYVGYGPPSEILVAAAIHLSTK